MNLKALVPWFGAKRTLAPRIVEAIGPHKVYWEPFVGSMAVLFAKKPSVMETVNDMHGDLVNFARAVAGEASCERLYARLLRMPPVQEMFADSIAVIRGGAIDRPQAAADPDYQHERAFHYFVVSWLGMNGVAGTAACNANFCKRFTSNGGAPGMRFTQAVESLPGWHQRLRKVVILSECGIELCERIEDKPGTVIYCDPPYLVKSGKYLHDFKAADHERLARALQRYTKTRVVVSYYEHPDLDRLYPGWKRVCCEVAKAMVASGRRDGKNDAKAPEVLLINERQGELF